MAKLLLLLFLFSFGAAPSCPTTAGVRIELSHVDSQRDFTKLDLLKRAAERVMTSGSNVQSTVDVQTQLYAGGGSFLMELAIGTPTLSYSAIMDTGSDLIWTQCQPCLRCFSQLTPLYDPSRSSTYATLPCNASQCLSLPSFTRTCAPPASDCSYDYTYGDNSSTDGVLGTETFTFGSVAVSEVAFGCSNNNNGNFDNSSGSGIVGMGRGNLSLVSQLGDGRFSYCLTSYGDNKTSPLLLGAMATLSEQAQSTPFVANPPSFPSYYYLSLHGITVGDTELPIPNTTFSMTSNGTGGLVIDSGTTVTMLVDPAYAELKRAFESQMNLSAADGSAYGYDICFAYGGEAVQVPRLVFHFEGADMDLPPENYIVVDSGAALLCVVVVRSNLTLSIFGNFQQQNMHVLYDLAGGTLSFEAAQCDQL
ncbi:aspartic proteinase nepenthesin-1-like [Zingiber officinale]|uniref:Peptidase A1 domain-containing protein n=1 Tax=Zingiber officinale TaxID=94328 RepID=A0A8J5HWD2_ZINOF|nr:aspartic proteinase nepenthesin-1-like [Zingiber officinale]KAG6537007.1 hypothetical protein ZIOFF_002085 [Zingiber officinale]